MYINIQGKNNLKLTYTRISTEIAPIPPRSFSEATDNIYSYEMTIQYPSYYESQNTPNRIIKYQGQNKEEDVLSHTMQLRTRAISPKNCRHQKTKFKSQLVKFMQEESVKGFKRPLQHKDIILGSAVTVTGSCQEVRETHGSSLPSGPHFPDGTDQPLSKTGC